LVIQYITVYLFFAHPVLASGTSSLVKGRTDGRTLGIPRTMRFTRETATVLVLDPVGEVR